MFTVPAEWAQRLSGMFQGQGTAWLQRLPTLIAECADQWSLTMQPPFEPLSYNYVAPAVCRDATPVVLKLGMPQPELFAEMEALRWFNGRGMVQLLAADRERGALLLERLTPGSPLVELPDDEQATIIAAGVMRQLWMPVAGEHPFPSVGDWAAGLSRLRAHFGGTTGPLPAPLVDAAESLFVELLSSMAEPVLLHGDLHHWNIVAAERQRWLALDPKGVVGEPAYEVGALLRNPMPFVLKQPNPRRTLARRVDVLSDLLSFERERIVGWTLAQAVLSACWSIEDGGSGAEEMIAFAELVAALRP